jgi:glycosyltransferase involved in cell wall biosynthesis
MQVLVNIGDLRKKGGVASYFLAVKPYLGRNVSYFTIGSRVSDKTIVSSMTTILRDYLSFIYKLHRERPDLVQLNPSLTHKAIIRDAVFLLIVKLFRIKIIVFMHGWDPKCERYIRKYFSSLFQIVYFQADAFIVLSNEIKAKIEKMGYRKTIFVDTTAVDETIFDSSTSLNETVVSSSFIDNNKNEGFKILFLAHVEKEKGIYETLDAYRILKGRYSQITLTVAGDGTELQRVREYVRLRDIKDVTFLGHVQNQQKKATFRNASVYLFPSYHEGMPISVLEAMAYGLPVVTRPVGGLKDFFESGKMGYITQSLNPVKFAYYTELLINRPDLRTSISCYNRSYALKYFAASRVASRLKTIYKKVLAEIN